MYGSVLTSVLAIPLTYLLRANTDAAAIVRSASTQLSTMMAVLVVLGSKLVYRKAHNAEKAAKKAVAEQKRGACMRERWGQLAWLTWLRCRPAATRP